MRYRIPWPESEGIMTTPIRIQRLRTKGFNLQAASMAANGLPCVYVGRPTKWGNPFTIAGCREWDGLISEIKIRSRVVGAFDAWLRSPYWRTNWDGPESKTARDAIIDSIGELRGENLACFCPIDQPCHADILLKLANS